MYYMYVYEHICVLLLRKKLAMDEAEASLSSHGIKACSYVKIVQRYTQEALDSGRRQDCRDEVSVGRFVDVRQINAFCMQPVLHLHVQRCTEYCYALHRLQATYQCTRAGREYLHAATIRYSG